MNFLKIGTDDHWQVADALTKALPKPAFTAHCGVMMNIKTTTSDPHVGVSAVTWWITDTRRCVEPVPGPTGSMSRE
eukprot:1903896-Rhodomonas_salina.1